MRRRTFDILMASAGLFLAVTLIFAGVMAAWAHTFIGNEVHTQLAAGPAPQLACPSDHGLPVSHSRPGLS